MARIVLELEIDGTPVGTVQRASWALGPARITDELTPGTISVEVAGEVAGDPGDTIVLSCGSTILFTGLLDSIRDRRDVAGRHWSSITGTDVIGTLGAAELDDFTTAGTTANSIGADASNTATGVSITFYDRTSRGLVPCGTVGDFDPFTGSLLDYMNAIARASNAIMTSMPNGQIHTHSRQSFYAPTVSNGSFDTNTSGWAGVNGGAISRVTASPYAGAGNARIVSSSTAYSGARAAITGKFRPYHTYRLTLQARTISGSADALFILGETGTDDQGAVKTLTASWAPYTVDWTPSDLRTAVYVDARNNAAASNTFEIDSVTITEVVDPLDITGGIGEWTRELSVDSVVNAWRIQPGGGGRSAWNTIPASVAAYGQRVFEADAASVTTGGEGDDGDDTLVPFASWASYADAAAPRWIVTAGTVIVTDDADPALALAPFDWIDDGEQAWMVLSTSWTMEPGGALVCTVTADDLLALL